MVNEVISLLSCSILVTKKLNKKGHFTKNLLDKKLLSGRGFRGEFAFP